MLVNEDEIKKRLNNPLNLLNRMREGLTPPKRSAMDLFTKGKTEGVLPDKPAVSFNGIASSNLPATIPSSVVNVTPTNTTEQTPSVPSSDDLIDDADSKIKLATAHDKALSLLNTSLDKLHSKIDNDQIKASSIPSVIASASKVITEIRKERLERDKANKQENTHFHFYVPAQKKIEEYEVIEVNG